MSRFFRLDGEGYREKLAGWLRALLEREIVDAVLSPQWTTSGRMVVPTLVRDPRRLTTPDPVAPVVSVSAATLAARLTFNQPQERAAVLLRSCEVRALVELEKLEQADLGRLLLVGVDCLGTVKPAAFAECASDEEIHQAWWQRGTRGEWPLETVEPRSACDICLYPAPGGVDLRLAWIGCPELLVESVSPRGEQAMASLELEEVPEPSPRAQLLGQLAADRRQRRERTLEEFRARHGQVDHLMEMLAPCIRCYNCRRACPLCYCHECVFEGPIFRHPSQHLHRWAARRGIIEMPTDTLLFHLTRLNHMGSSCVSCGMCEAACPSQLPVSLLFAAVGETIQQIFDYEPGRDREEELPLATFREEELEPR